MHLILSTSVRGAGPANKTFALTPEDRAALADYWKFYESHAGAITAEVQAAISTMDEWRSVFAGRSAVELDEHTRREHELLRSALREGRWEPYLEWLRQQGIEYADAGVSLARWLDLASAFRMIVRTRIVALADEDGVATAARVSHGLHRFVDIAIRTVGELYAARTQTLEAVAEDRIRAMFENNPHPMWMFDRETLRFVEVNEAAVRHYGFSRDEFLRMTIEDIRPPEDVAALHEDIEQRRSYTSRVWRHRKKDGTPIAVEISATDFMLHGRGVRLVLAYDVTERERAQQKLRKTEEQLQHAEKLDALGRLAGGVAHDFNNLLTVIQSYACMLEDQLDPSDSRRQDAVEIRRATERAHNITRQLLTLSRHSIISPRSVDLSELVAGFVPVLRRLVGEHVSLVTHCAAVPPVIADPGQLEQVLMNLAVNARDAMPSGGRLTVETQLVQLDAEAASLRGLVAGSYTTIVVTDTGHGMDDETRAKIFEPFFTTKEAGKGTGLGLAIVHGIVSQAGGTVSIYSEPGHGTAFWIYLPISSAPLATQSEEPVAVSRALPAITVLVVEDQSDVRAVICRILRESGCHVLEAATGEEARRVCVSHEGGIDAVVTDIVLADTRGDTLTQQLRDLRPGIKSVLMSGYPAGALSETGGAPPDLLVKPFTPAELRAALVRAIGDPGATSSAEPRARAANQRRVLVADDDDTLRRAVARALQRSNCEVVAVDCGKRAIAELEAAPFDVILSDVHMPDGTGLDLLRAVRRIDLDVPVILMSGMPDVQTASQAVEYGVFRYLVKPLDIIALPKLVEHAARVHALARLRRDALSVTGVHAAVGAVDRAGLEVRFDQALDRLWMAFQPIVEARTGALFGVEALVRSDEPSMPTPPSLLDAATQLGSLPQLGRRVRALSAAAMASRPDHVALFVNLHPDDLLDIELLEADAPLTQIASRVVLEVTERASLHRLTGLSERVQRLRALGFRLAVDDIGAGYSGLTSFTELTPEVVKLDMSLVRDIHLSALKQRTVSALCKLCHDVGCIVVGEGVETLDERECLVSVGCDLLQGYLIGRPSRDGSSRT